MKFRIFQKIFVLFFCCWSYANGQQNNNVVGIELGPSTFTVERPYTISVVVRNSENRPVITFPDIQGLTKRGTETRVTTDEVDGQTVVNQVITQTYIATQPGVFRLQPFTITVNNGTAYSEGAVLLIRPGSTAPFGGTGTAGTLKMTTESGAAFLSLRAGKAVVFVGEGFAMRLSLFVSDTYPFELRFDGVDAQLQTVLKQLRPTNAWEENAGIQQLKGQPIIVNGRKFTEYVIFQSVFFPLSNNTIQIPSVALTLTRVRQDNREETERPGKASVPPTPERITFQTRPLTIAVRPLPPHPLRGQVAVGSYRLIETIDRKTVPMGKSARYTVRLEGEGNVASLQTPLWSTVSSASVTVNPSVLGGNVDVLPSGTNLQIDRTGEQIYGFKSFTYFLIPRRDGTINLSDVFGFVYFDPQTTRYDTLQSRISLKTGGTGSTDAGLASQGTLPQTGEGGDALYARLNEMDSTQQPLNLPSLMRAIANVLLVLMILGMIFVFFRK